MYGEHSSDIEGYTKKVVDQLTSLSNLTILSNREDDLDKMNFTLSEFYATCYNKMYNDKNVTEILTIFDNIKMINSLVVEKATLLDSEVLYIDINEIITKETSKKSKHNKRPLKNKTFLASSFAFKEQQAGETTQESTGSHLRVALFDTIR